MHGLRSKWAMVAGTQAGQWGSVAMHGARLGRGAAIAGAYSGEHGRVDVAQLDHQGRHVRGVNYVRRIQ